MSLQSRARGGSAWLDQTHFCAPFHVWHSISLSDKQSEQSVAPRALITGHHVSYKGLSPLLNHGADIMMGEDRALGEL